jgi:anti-sigma B factor antagonist
VYGQGGVADLAIETRTDDGRVTLVLSGEFDMASVPRFEDELAAVEAGAPATIVVDLDRLQFMDSSGLRALVAADDRARHAGRRLAIVPGPPQIRRVFEITHLHERLDLVDDAADV